MNVKITWDSLRCKYQLKQITKTRGQIFATNENCFLRKMSLKFQNPSFSILCKIAFWSKQKWLKKKQIIWSRLPRLKDSLFGGTAWKNDESHLQEIFRQLGTEPAYILYPQPA